MNITIAITTLILPLTLFANRIEKRFIRAGLIDIHSVDTSIQVDLVNSNDQNNFFRKNFYRGLQRAYLQKEAALKLQKAQKLLKQKYPKYSLCVLDAARPRSVSQKMYDTMKGTEFEKFVANPTRGSMHNYGVAVDVTIVDSSGAFLDMGFTPFHKTHEEIKSAYMKSKKDTVHTRKQRNNRKLLLNIMKKAGFYELSYEWWHFNALPKKEARAKYSIIE